MFPACGVGNREDIPPEPEGLMLVGGAPTMCPDQVRRKIFCTTYFFFENQSMVDFQIKNQSSGSDLDENGRFLF